MFDFLRNITKSAEEKQQEALSAYLSDALSPKERQQFEAQLAQDPGLQAELEQMRALRQAMRQMPPRRVPRNFTLDPAVYGRPARQPLIQAYPILRGATALTAVFLIFALAAGLFTGLGSGAQSMAVEMAPAAEVALEAAPQEEVVTEGEAVEVTRIVTETVLEMEAADTAVEEMEIPAEELLAEEAPAEAPPLVEAAATKAMAPDNLVGAAEAEEALPSPTPTASPTPTMTPTPPSTAVPLAQTTMPAPSSRQAGDSEVSNGQAQVSVEPTVMAFEAEEISGEETAVSPLSALTPLQWLQLGLLLLLLVLAAITLYARRQLK
jgi:hypothetical protein